MNAIACVDLNWGLGKDNKLLYRIPEDMEFFKGKTKGKVVIYGNSTLKSFPLGRPLKDRINIVITSNRDNISEEAINNSCTCTKIEVQSNENLNKIKNIIRHNRYVEFNMFNSINNDTIDFNDKPILLIATSIEQAIEFARTLAYDEDIWVCGGSTIYEQMIPYIDTFWITKVYQYNEADRFLLNLDKMEDEDELPYFIPVQIVPKVSDNNIYSFICYRKKSKYIEKIRSNKFRID